MMVMFLCTEGVQRRLPCLLLTLMKRKGLHTEKRPSSKWAKVFHSPESARLYLGYKDILILSVLFVKKYLTFGNDMYSMQKIRFEPVKTLCLGYESIFSSKSKSRFPSVQKGYIYSDLQVLPQILRKHKGRTALQNCLYCSVRHASDVVSVRERIAEENRKTRAHFEACEKKWEELIDERLLQPEDLKIHEAHKLAVARGHFTYDDPITGYRVMTRLRHFLRGSCCGNACRHCVYDHANVAEKEKLLRVFNSSFWVDVSTRPDLAVVAPRTYHVKSRDSSNRNDEEDDRKTNESEVNDPLLFKH